MFDSFKRKLNKIPPKKYETPLESIYTCDKCGFEFDGNGINRFFIDNETSEIHEFMILFSTVGIDYKSNIKGEIAKSYCSTCNKKVETYIIEHYDCDEEEAINIVKNAIKNRKKLFEKNINKRHTIIEKDNCIGIKTKLANEIFHHQRINKKYSREEIISKFEKQIQKLIKEDYKRLKIKLKRDKKIIRIIKIANNDSTDDKIECPVCNNPLDKYLFDGKKCPYCEGTMKETYFTFYD